jgi:hypothetical protein
MPLHASQCPVKDDPVDPQRDPPLRAKTVVNAIRRVTARQAPISLDEAVATIRVGDEIRMYILSDCATLSNGVTLKTELIVRLDISTADSRVIYLTVSTIGTQQMMVCVSRVALSHSHFCHCLRFWH